MVVLAACYVSFLHQHKNISVISLQPHTNSSMNYIHLISWNFYLQDFCYYPCYSPFSLSSFFLFFFFNSLSVLLYPRVSSLKLGLENTILFHIVLKFLSVTVASILKRVPRGPRAVCLPNRGTSLASNCAVGFLPHCVVLSSRRSNFEHLSFSSLIFSQGTLYCHLTWWES